MEYKIKKNLLILLGVGVVACALTCSAFGEAGSISTSKSVKTSWLSFPYKSVGVSKAKLLVEREIPDKIVPKKEYTVSLRVTNKSMYKIDGVILVEKLPVNFKFLKAEPTPSVHGNTLEWSLGMMAPGQKEIVSITGMALGAGDIEHAGKVNLKYELGQMITIMEVIEPKLRFNVVAPESAIVNDPIPVECVFKNAGSAPVVNAVINDKLPSGLNVQSGGNAINVNLGTIQPNITKKYDLNLFASKAGSYNVKLTAKADDNITSNAYLKIFVGKPKLSVTSKAPTKRFVGNNIRYTINVQNTGNAIARDVSTVLTVPATAKFVSANEGGLLDGNTVKWDISSLQPNETKKLELVLVGKTITTLDVNAITKAVAAESVRTNFRTTVAGIPALLLVLSDVNDPVPVGETETFIIDIDNQGSLAAENIVVLCELENNMEFVSVTGPTGKDSLKGTKLVLKTLTTLDPGKKAIWKVTVRAKSPGDCRFKVYLKSKHLSRPVYESESTHFYQ